MRAGRTAHKFFLLLKMWARERLKYKHVSNYFIMITHFTLLLSATSPLSISWSPATSSATRTCGAMTAWKFISSRRTGKTLFTFYSIVWALPTTARTGITVGIRNCRLQLLNSLKDSNGVWKRRSRGVNWALRRSPEIPWP